MTTRISSIETIGKLNCSKTAAWEKVCFYEHVKRKPTWFLRTVLPVPARTSGRYQQVGDISRCQYSDGGYLTKRITDFRDKHKVDFEIIEQSIRFHHRVRLCGGTIELIETDHGQTTVRMQTHYANGYKPAFISDVFVRKVIQAMHAFVIKDMQLCLAQHNLSVDQTHPTIGSVSARTVV